jgi:hypothetical protein
MQPWFQVVEPYEFIGELGKREELLVADLGDVISGIAHPLYKDPELFVRTTFFTSGLLRLLKRVQNKLNSGTGNAVIRLQNYLGGGKTHSLIALYHFLNNHENLFSFLPKTVLPSDISVVSITGTHLNPLEGRKIENLEIRTIWGEIAYQLSGIEGFKLIAENDRKRISPGKELLQMLFKQMKPQVILLDEITEYLAKAKGVSVNESNLATQTLVFIQELTECISTLSKSILIISLPDIEYEEVKNSNKSALIEISQIIGRIASSEVPFEHRDLYQIIQHKLIKRVILPKELTQIVNDFSDFYLSHKKDFPEIAIKPIYKSLMEQSYPFHPALIDLLYDNWNEIPTFQGTRSILSLLSQILASLLANRSETPLILTSDVDLKKDNIRDSLFHHLPAKFTQILVKEINYETTPSTGREIDHRWKETFGAIIQTIFLASSQYKSKNCGLNLQEIIFHLWKPNLSSAFTTEVLNSLVNTSQYLHISQNRYSFSEQLNFNNKINQMKSMYREKALQQMPYELETLIQEKDIETIIWPDSQDEITDSIKLKIVLLPPTTDKSSDIEHWFHYRGKKFRLYRNTILLGVPDEIVIEDMLDTLQLKFALEEYLATYKKEQNPDSIVIESIKVRIEEVDARILYLIRRVYLEFRDWNNSYRIEVPKNDHEVLSKFLLNELLRTEVITAEIHPMFIVDKFFDEKRIFQLHSLKDQFLKNERLPKLLSNSVLKQSLKRGVNEGYFALIKLNPTKNQIQSYHFKDDIEIEEIKFEEREFITDWKKDEISNYLKKIPLTERKTLTGEVKEIKTEKGDSKITSSDLILQFKEINPELFSSLQKGIINPLYEKSKDLKIDLTIQIQNPDSLDDQFLISLIKDTTDQLGGKIQNKNNLKPKEKKKKNNS